MQEPIDLLLEPRWIIPIEPPGEVWQHHAIAIRGEDILAVGPVTELEQRYLPRERLRLPEHVIIPGLVNLHTHGAMTLMRGLADDLPLERWLREAIWPAEARHVSAAFVADGTRLACAEMLLGGITCFNDMYFFPGAAAEAVVESGMRAVLGLVTLEFPNNYAVDAEDHLHQGLAALDTWGEEARLGFTLAPHAPYTVSDKTFERIATLAAQLDLPIHIHIHETAQEITESLATHAVRPLARLHRLGLLGPGFIGVHGVHLDENDLALMEREGCALAHCPTSNLKLASGIAPLTRMLQKNITVGLGTDGAVSNNRLDLFGELRLAALLAKGSSGDATACGVHEALHLATLGGAKALGMEKRIGSIRPGKAADLCAVRFGGIFTTPCFDPASHLVFTASREQVSHVWVGGKPLVHDGRLVYIDPYALLPVTKLWQNKIQG